MGSKKLEQALSGSRLRLQLLLLILPNHLHKFKKKTLEFGGPLLFRRSSKVGQTETDLAVRIHAA